MRVVRVTRDLGVDEGATNDARHMIDQRVLNHAVRNVDDMMGVELEEADLGGAEATADGQASAMTKRS